MAEVKNLAQLFLKQARKQKRKLGIGIINPEPDIVKSLKKGLKYADLIVVGSKIHGFECIPTKDDKEGSRVLIKLLKDRKIEGLVRGQLKDSQTLNTFMEIFGKRIPHNRKMGPAVMESPNGKISIILVSGSIYHGLSLEDKIYEAERTIKYMEDFGIKPKIGIMSSRRPTGVVGEFPFLEELAQRCAGLAEHLRKKGYEVEEVYIELETAIKKGCNLIIPSLGLIGNAVFRALCYYGGWKLISCPYLDLGVVYEDGSRNERDFSYHIIHAVAMLNSQK